MTSPPPAESPARLADVTALILAGGRSRRMGGKDKAWFPYGGRPMLRWVLDVVRPHVAEVIISANHNRDAYRSLGCTVVCDRTPGHAGPLAGVLAALDQVRTDYLYVVPCDVPNLDARVLHRLRPDAVRSAAAVAHDGERLQPLIFLMRTHQQPALAQYLDSGYAAAHLWHDLIHSRIVPMPDLADCFRNINTPEDLGAGS